MIYRALFIIMVAALSAIIAGGCSECVLILDEDDQPVEGAILYTDCSGYPLVHSRSNPRGYARTPVLGIGVGNVVDIYCEGYKSAKIYRNEKGWQNIIRLEEEYASDPQLPMSLIVDPYFDDVRGKLSYTPPDPAPVSLQKKEKGQVDYDIDGKDMCTPEAVEIK
ncbi:MAG: hypothetical protein JXR97_16815 [Planctomycetes bacterium]|nr:hypothetical protein [Planctomycetota bacterium]